VIRACALGARLAAVIAVLALIALSGCSSPADVEKIHRDAESVYQKNLARAEEWNTHVLGIPSSGWLAIVILSICLGVVLLILLGVWRYNVQERRAADRRSEKNRQFELDKALVDRGNCHMCGADPSVAANVKKSVEKERNS
jgi:heme/copper-type cytochrome/quinol oxidase subunit 2